MIPLSDIERNAKLQHESNEVTQHTLQTLKDGLVMLKKEVKELRQNAGSEKGGGRKAAHTKQ